MYYLFNWFGIGIWFVFIFMQAFHLASDFVFNYLAGFANSYLTWGGEYGLNPSPWCAFPVVMFFHVILIFIPALIYRFC